MIDRLVRPVNYVWFAIVVTIVSLVGAAVSLAGNGAAPRDTTWGRLQQDNTLVVGIDISFPPFGAVEENQAIGIDSDLARALAEELGVNVHIVPIGFDSMYDTLLTGGVDMLIAALRPDPQREGIFRYTSPYFDAGYVFVGYENVPERMSELNGQTIGVPFATDADVYLQNVLENDRAVFQRERLLSVDEVIAAVGEQHVDLALLDAVSAYEAQQTYPNLIISNTRLIEDPYVIAVRHSDWKLYFELEQALKQLQQDGRLAEILVRWL